MKKLTKLLSVFVVAGTLCAGAAALAGCGGDEPHTHTPVEHEAKAATCTEVGYTQKYYTCDSDECAGKYYSDEACTTELDLATITAQATGHTEKYTDKGNGTHGITCEHNDLTETTEAHADANDDSKCDKCKVTVHKGTLVEEVKAGCTTTGVKAYYTSTDEGCEGKKYSDETCTAEVTEADLVIEALGHKYEVVANSDATHREVCSVCGDVKKDGQDKVDIDCTDANSDGKCDVCGGDLTFKTALVAGTYINKNQSTEIVIKDGTLVYNEETMTLSAVTEGACTCTSASGTEYTLTGERGGYTLSYEMEGWWGPEKVSVKFETAPEKLAEDKEDLVGVYSGELVYENYAGKSFKLTKFVFTEGGYLRFTEVATESEEGKTNYPVTIVEDVKNYTLFYNELSVAGKEFTVSKAEGGAVKEIKLSYNGTTAVFALTDEKVSEVPAALPLEDKTLYVGDNYKLAASVSAYDSGEKIYMLNGTQFTLVDGNETDGFVVKAYDSNYNVVNYVVKVISSTNTVELYEADGTTKLATLALTPLTFPELVADGTTVNENAVIDAFNESYGYYIVKETGWYVFGAKDAPVTLYTEFDETSGQPVSWGSGVITVDAESESDPVQLTKGAKIALESYYATAKFVAKYSATKPEPEYAAITGSSYAINSFKSSKTYYVKAVVPAAGTYCISLTSSNSANFDSPRGAKFTVGEKVYGYVMDASYNWAEATDGLVYQATLEADQEIKIEVSCDNEYLSLGTVTVYFETKAEYDARVEGSQGGGDIGGGDIGGGEEDVIYGQVGPNTVDCGLINEAEVVLKEAGNWTITFGENLSYIMVGNSPKPDGAVIEVGASPVTIRVFATDNSSPVKFTLAYEESSSGGDVGGGETSANTLALGANTVTGHANPPANVYTFTGEAGKKYTISWEGDDLLVSPADSFDVEPYVSGAVITADANGQFKLYLFSNKSDASGNYVNCTVSLTVAEAAQS